VLVYRIGIGWDRHRLVAGRPCVLGGVRFPESPTGPLGHSDGDAVCHAIIDALLGAAALGDIGRLYPDSDPAYAAADSLQLLARTVDRLYEAGYRVGNVDCTVVAEEPWIASRAAAMSDALAGALQVAAGAVSIKGTRGEGLGPEGRQECITVVAVAFILTAADS
jgi:2-C-methyl-D-erythritol 2,4-cyclodiphosphate synthase